MMKRQRSVLNVVVLCYTDTKPDWDRVRGILRFSIAHPEWNVLMLPGHPANRTGLGTKNWKPDGIITNLYILSHAKDGARQWANVPNAVLMDAVAPSKKLATNRQECIDNDNPAIGRTAAEFFIKRGFHHFAYVPPLLPRRWSDERAAAFVATVRAAGGSCAVYDKAGAATNDWEREERRLADWLAALPKPCGLLGANDDCAQQTMRICTLSGINVPRQISILGVDNNDFTCTFSRPSLSSIETEYERCGFLAAEALHRLMTGGPPSSTVTHYGNPRIVERDSTQDPRGTAHIVERARSYITKYAASDITISDIAAAAGVSPRTLERRFATIGGTSPRDELRTARIAIAQKLLRDTSTPIGEIAPLCGFNSDIYLKIAFKKACGMTMRDYRKSGG